MDDHVEMPPAQDSPKHILNALNDDCIQSIFRQMDCVRDFLSAAETCRGFQENAKLTFRTKYRKIRVGELYNKSDNTNTVTVNRLPSLLNIFGHLIVNIYFDGEELHNDIQNMIADHCGKTLRTFKICSSNVVNFNTRSPFQALAELEILDTNIRNFECTSQLRRLVIWGRVSDWEWLIQPFPQLEIVTLYVVHELRFDQAVEFLKLNPQLKSLYIRLCKQITPQIYENIANLTPNLEKLFVHLHSSSPSLNEHMLHIGKLQNLRSLAITARVIIPVGRLIECLIENKVLIEFLGILNDYTQFSTSKLNILELKQLKKLCITQMSDETLLEYVKHLPALEEMICVKQDNIRSISPKISLAGIKKALKYGEHLSALSVDTKDMTIDSDDFKSVLSLAKQNRVKVTIVIENGTINVPNELLEANRKWLDVMENSFLKSLRCQLNIDTWFE
ncbi:uncharacterized protein LOC129566062 [Sitodiplosis mosellana]|uniref:uncharacterized protein LOC129566062 n=1 Tax=Sitodiplosis mosellana TaxID=263140 RepID=UPI0024443EB0|nr:uncharacterized protein LOC129566062 [Sitodiplosis mosellana]